MASSSPPTRRDRRYAVLPGSATVEYAVPAAADRSSARLTRVSVSGIAFEAEREGHGLERGTWLEGLSVRIGECVVQGDAQIKNFAPAGETTTEVGCLFFPAAPDSENRWLAVIAGIEAVLQP